MGGDWNEGLQKTPAERLETTLETFLEWLCLEWGICGSAGHDRVALSSDSWTADELAEEVLRAEGIGPLEPNRRTQIANEFVPRFGPTFSVGDFEGED